MPGIVEWYFWLVSKYDATFFKYILRIFSKESFTFLYISKKVSKTRAKQSGS